MKKSLVVFLVIFFLLPTIFAVEFDMKKEYNQGETLIAKVSGNFLEPILKQNVFFYRGHVRIPLVYDVAKINDEYYIYALLDKPEENYTLSIENVKYMVGKNISEEDIKKDFRITNNTADFSVNRGFIVTDKDFFVKVQNLQDRKMNITIKDNYNTHLVELKSGEIVKLNFELQNNSNMEFTLLELSTENLKYEIPVYVFSINKSEKTLETNFKLEPGELKISMPTNSKTRRILYLYNTGETTLDNLSFFISKSLAQYINFSINNFNELMPNESMRIELNFSSFQEENTVKGKLTVKQDETYAYVDISLNFIPDYIPSKKEKIKENITIVSETCAEKNGSICSEKEKCDGETVYAKDDVCCLGSCREIKKSSTGKIIGWSMIIVIFLFLVWFFKTKYRGAKKQINLLNIGKRK